MGEYLQLVAPSLNEAQLRQLLAQGLGEHPELLARLEVQGQTVATKLATCNHVFFAFEELVALNRFITAHGRLLEYGPNHRNNDTLAQILRRRESIYFQRHDRSTRAQTVLVPQEKAIQIEHSKVWRKTKKTLSRNGKWYRRKLRPDETSGVRGNPNGYRVTCPNQGMAFKATEVAFGWDAATNQGRRIFQCPACKTLFNLGEHPTPEHAQLARDLTEV